MDDIKTINDLNEFLVKFIDSYIINDLKKLMQINSMHQTSYPYLALVFSGIDFYGALEKGVTEEVGKRFRWFIKEWIARINQFYKEDYLVNLIYDSCRNGILHNAVLKNSFNLSSYLYPKSKHLHVHKESDLVFFHAIQFTEDFLSAQDLYREYINSSMDKSYISKLCNNLSEMIKKNLSKNINDSQKLIKTLKAQGLIFVDDESKKDFSTITTPVTTASIPIQNQKTTMTVPPLSK
jgi:hypothetical protein